LWFICLSNVYLYFARAAFLACASAALAECIKQPWNDYTSCIVVR
jgi:hypothetical protein